MKNYLTVNVSYDKELTPIYTDEAGKTYSHEQLKELKKEGIDTIYQYPTKD